MSFSIYLLEVGERQRCYRWNKRVLRVMQIGRLCVSTSRHDTQHLGATLDDGNNLLDVLALVELVVVYFECLVFAFT